MAISWFLLGLKGGLGRGRAGRTCSLLVRLLQTRSRLDTVSMKRIVARSLTVGIADAEMEVDGKKIYEGKDLCWFFQEGQLGRFVFRIILR